MNRKSFGSVFDVEAPFSQKRDWWLRTPPCDGGHRNVHARPRDSLEPGMREARANQSARIGVGSIELFDKSG